MHTPADSTGLAQSPDSSGRGVGGLGAHTGPLQCLLCNGVRYRPVFREHGIDILRCDSCGHVFSSFRADPHYTGFWGTEVAPGKHFYWSKARTRTHSAFFRRFVVQRSGRLLDMGSGLGFFLKAMAAYPAW